ncbi:cytochrome b561 and DOMON domain-containing protein [Panicum miliaceum]|uniref:Cytochrome b561 and DOMON domain-containing protein n=1 Tax=Panicum miliaceum TaxID=4540 RepID=A0A3L6PQ26_PANMI|nr:cytochrome b561 and DOMON domain-containing protein [Panicum miliaceum]
MAAAGTAPRRLSASSAIVSLAIVLAAVATCSSLGAEAAACSSHTFSGKGGGSCADLLRLGAALHYNYTAATNTVSVAFRTPQGEDDGWVAWGINPSGRAGMVGTNAVVAFRRANGTLAAYPTVLDSYAPSMAPATPGDLAFPVSGVAAEHDAEGKEMVVYATVALPAGKGSKFTHVWQKGSAVVNDVPAAHPTTGDNVLSTATIDFSE